MFIVSFQLPASALSSSAGEPCLGPWWKNPFVECQTMRQ